MKISTTKNKYISLLSVAFMLIIWKLLAIHFNSDFVLPSPERTFFTTIALFTEKQFVAIIGATILRGVLGFAISLVFGVGVGILAGISPGFNAFLKPILVTIRSTPVIALILLALIWLSSTSVPIFIAILTMFPFICTNVIDGIRSVDHNLVEMANFYKVKQSRIVRDVYIPAIMPFVISGASSAMGIGWRAIIIGEVLSQPRFGIGTVMQSAQTFLNVDAVIAWTIIAVIVSYLFEKIIRWGERRIVTWRVQP
ncbi:MAG TPA: ABC transporter permease subunit [Tenuifilaceae bacterium]|nr:ABC transporter permease subunit [Tenuifilaceae bacterium]HPJ45539.1 ABC transporter permease subunit [Tenuifilaceae bacterium]HPQ33807.1 ABC transporter permease subunit [Tenuifilaceae bacterium]